MRVNEVFIKVTCCIVTSLGAATVDPADFHSLTSPTSPISPLRDWDPMQEDFHSSKNTYSVNTDDLDIAFQGYRKLTLTAMRPILIAERLAQIAWHLTTIREVVASNSIRINTLPLPRFVLAPTLGFELSLTLKNQCKD